MVIKLPVVASRNNPQQSSNHLLSQSMRGRKGAHVAGPFGKKLLMSITKRPRRQAAMFLPGSALYGEPAYGIGLSHPTIG